MLGISLATGLFFLISVRAELDYIGPCRNTIQTDPNVDFEQFAKENNGKWNFVKIPDTPALSDISNLELTVNKGEDGMYKSTITSAVAQGKKRLLSDETIENAGNGLLKATTKDGNEFQVYFLKYKPSKYAYYFVCGKNGGDNNVDYRYVLSHEPLSEEDSDDIYKLEKHYNFKGDLKEIYTVFY
ncbi:uncharacterized protein LOC128983651 [Macrosteles quadrilineatus]|uniref:uncharacterized protein LOC128983651 n=1 Tax=Macrosteles quadrilineatus TaxID=74068 RepID=UPI0023E24320|nr:uncharacterized protein LOC128983651 [Macrosteles quadrilineatus]